MRLLPLLIFPVFLGYLWFFEHLSPSTIGLMSVAYTVGGAAVYDAGRKSP